jgi:hypothetical protein
MTSGVRVVLDKFLSGDEESAFYDLIDLPGNLLADLVQEFHAAGNSEIRALLVKAAWERKEKGVIPFLGDALTDRDELVWQQALDGLVAHASHEAHEILLAARAQDFSDETLTNRFRLWLEEAILQVEFELRAKT